MQPDDGSPPERLGQEFPNRERQKNERFFANPILFKSRFWVGGADEAMITARSNGSKEGMRVETRCG
jgi:hypothetical protein